MSRLLCSFFLLLLFHSVAAAEVKNKSPVTKLDNEKVFKIAEEMSDCSGAFYALSKLQKAIRQPKKHQLFHEMGNGYYVVAAYQLYALKVVPVWKNALQFAEQRALVKSNYFLALVESDRSKSKKASVTEIEKTLDYCNSVYGKFQAEEITRIRRELYQLKGRGK